MSQVKAIAEQVIAAVQNYMAQSMAGVARRLQELDEQIKAIPAPLKGDKGDRGDDAEVTDEQLAVAVKAYIAENPIPVPQDGKSVTAEEVLPQLKAELTKAIEALPKPVDGKNGLNAYEVAVSLGFEGSVHDWMKSLDGKPGDPGKPGLNGKSVTAEEVIPALTVEVQKAIAALPVPKDGKDSEVTAEDFLTLFEAEQAKALLDFERRLQDRLQKAIDRIEKPKDGKDGVGFEDMEVLFDGERTVTMKFVRGEVVKEFPFTLPIPIDRGVWKSGESYARGDSVSFGGSIFIAQRDTGSKPETDDSWRLSVKRGRDGKDGIGIKGDKGDPGKNGRDLTQLGTNGERW